MTTDKPSERSDWEKHKKHAGMIAIWIVSGCVGFAMLIGALMVLGQMIEVAGQQSEDHDRCLKHATNGYEIKQCR